VAEKGIQEAWALQRGRIGESAWQPVAPRVLVTGLGPIAFAGLLAGRCLGWPVTVTGRDRPETFRATLVVRFGATYVPADQLPIDPVDVERDGFDLILECTGSDEVLLRAARSLASCGVMVWLGSSRNPEPRSHDVDTLIRHAVLRNHVHVGSVNAAARDFELALRHLEQLQRECPSELGAIVTHRVRLDDALPHYRHRVPQGIKTVVEYS
jgi:threonine dehydrogenase-like Zn-dependent dehydrogenase